jgi:hypothetical protein
MQRDKAVENQERQLAHMQTFVDRFRASAARASMAQSRLKAMAKIERVAPLAVDPSIVFNFPDPEPIGTVNVIQLIDVAFGYDPVRARLHAHMHTRPPCRWVYTVCSRVCACVLMCVGKRFGMHVCVDMPLLLYWCMIGIRAPVCGERPCVVVAHWRRRRWVDVRYGCG